MSRSFVQLRRTLEQLSTALPKHVLRKQLSNIDLLSTLSNALQRQGKDIPSTQKLQSALESMVRFQSKRPELFANLLRKTDARKNEDRTGSEISDPSAFIGRSEMDMPDVGKQTRLTSNKDETASTVRDEPG